MRRQDVRPPDEYLLYFSNSAPHLFHDFYFWPIFCLCADSPDIGHHGVCVKPAYVTVGSTPFVGYPIYFHDSVAKKSDIPKISEMHPNG